MSSPRPLIPSLLLSLLLLGSSFVVAAAATSTTIALSPGADHGRPRVDVTAAGRDGLTLTLEIPSLEITDLELDARSFRGLDFYDGGHRGADGQPALPTVTRLVALPDGRGVAARLIDHDMASLGAMALAPNEPLRDGSKAHTPTFDAARYAAARPSEPEVLVGEPALLHGLRVVPITFSPVAYDPTTGRTEVARRMTVEVSFEGRDDRAGKNAVRTQIPESFAAIYEREVVGYVRGEDVYTGPGSYILICPNNAQVVSIVGRLADWRRRQGYNVLLVTTQTTGTSTTAIKTWLQQQYQTLEPPLEYVTLVGDANGTIAMPTWSESYSGYNGEGDHMYTTLDGPDVLPDIHIGRLSATTTTQLQLIVDKIVDYETDPYLTTTSWFTTAGLAGDPSTSGASCVYVNQFVKEGLLKLGYARVDTIFSGYFLSQMQATLNQGETIFGYRGYFNMSGMGASHILNLSNGRKLPFAVTLTCDTGSFRGDTTCRSEAFLRATNGGAVAAIGTATWGTATRYNNCMYLGIWNGFLNSPDHRVGPALSSGKVNMYVNYNSNESTRAWIYSTWNNLMGDPATAIFTAVPAPIDVAYPAQVSVGANALPVSVTLAGQPVAGARVAVYQSGESSVRDFAYTDAAGQAVLSIAGSSARDVLVTVTGTNLMPHLGQTTVGSVAQSLDVSAVTLSEVSGNGDGIANPGETWDVQLQLHNPGISSVTAAVATLMAPMPYVTVLDATASYGTVPAGGAAWGTFRVRVEADGPGGVTADLRLTATGSGQTWISLVHLPIQGPRGTVTAMTFGGPGGGIDPGENGTLSFDLSNVGDLATTGVTGTLSSSSRWLSVTDAQGSWGPVASGSSITQTDLFAISASPDCLPGHLAALRLTLTFAEGGTQELDYPVTIGTAGTGDPSGPCDYGYWAFDNADSHTQAPAYEWFEISAIGANTGISDTYRHGDDTRSLDLPFAFEFYGETFTRVSICSNGWLSFGNSGLKNYRNWMLPGAGSPAAMVAAFWTDLALGQVYTYHDTVQHRFVVQWESFRNYSGSSYSGTCTFQIILYDPSHHPTNTGDGLIVVQYKNVTIYAPPPETNYITVGIQDHKREAGLTYTYGNHYAGGAATVQAGRAIAFWPVGPNLMPTAVPEARPLLLAQNHPNPFNPQTVIAFDLPRTQTVQLRIYDLQGKLVCTLLDGIVEAGRRETLWRGHNDRGAEAPSGTYIYRLVTEDGDLVRKMTLLK